MTRAVPIIATFAALFASQATPGNEFVWRNRDHIIGRLTVPTGFVIETDDYREGTVTTLRYSDGATIVLQSGGMYRVPMFQDSDHKLTSSKELAAKTIRVGQIGSERCWREDNFKPRKVTGKSVSLAVLFPPNVGYTRVPRVRRGEFDRALDSFVREIDHTPHQDARRIRGSMIRQAYLVSKVEPVYPIVAQNNGIQGAVWLAVDIGKDGHVVSVQRISGHPALVEAAEDAVLQWVYSPTALMDGETFEVVTPVCVPFVPRQPNQTPSPCTDTIR
jgi:TonB family protein